MFTNVVIGLDRHCAVADAVALAEQLSAGGATLTLAHVYAGDAYVYQGVSAEDEASVRQQDLEFLAAARADHGLHGATRWRHATSVGAGLQELCYEVGADLLVVGTSARRHLGRVLPGDDARGALDGARCTVATAPTGYSDHPPGVGEIGIAYDGSPESERAVRVARDLAAAYRSRLSALDVVWHPRSVYVGPVGDHQPQIDEMLRSAEHRIRALGGVEPHVAAGIPAEELTVYSGTVDLLVMGSRGLGPLGRRVHGNTAQAVARRARCPLLVVPRAACLPTTAEADPHAARSGARAPQ